VAAKGSAKVHATRTKKLVLVFFDKGLINTNYRTMVKAKFIMEALGKFIKILKRKRPVMAPRDRWVTEIMPQFTPLPR
jgi:hypothetical protein